MLCDIWHIYPRAPRTGSRLIGLSLQKPEGRCCGAGFSDIFAGLLPTIYCTSKEQSLECANLICLDKHVVAERESFPP